MTDQQKIAEALKILVALSLPRAQQNERSALCLLALLNIGPSTKWATAFPNRATMSRHLGDLAWETEVWVADSPSHLIHFNGVRFLGPYSQN